MVDNLIEPYNADLALCTGQKSDTLPPLNALTKIAKYDWTFREPKHWYNYVEDFSKKVKLSGGKTILDMV